MARHVEQIAERFDELISAFNSALPQNLRLERDAEGRVHARWFNCRMTSVYQPIVQSTTNRIVGHEALLRCEGDDAALSPWNVFAHAGTHTDLVALDRLCRTLHTFNYFRQVRTPLSLFLNVQMGLLTTVQRGFGLDFQQRLVLFGLSPQSVVIELPYEALAEREVVTQAIGDYRERGYRVALSRPGAASRADWGLLLKLRPDIVKVDRSSLTDAVAGSEIVAQIHATKALALAEKLETEEDVERARLAGCDLLQGFSIGVPGSSAARKALRQAPPLACRTPVPTFACERPASGP